MRKRKNTMEKLSKDYYQKISMTGEFTSYNSKTCID
jgi:hypothetical protein